VHDGGSSRRRPLCFVPLQLGLPRDEHFLSQRLPGLPAPAEGTLASSAYS
jgi:hypothetical protein